MGGFPVNLDFGGPIFFNSDLVVQERQGFVFRFFHYKFDVGVSDIDMVGEFFHVIDSVMLAENSGTVFYFQSKTR